MPSPTQGSCGFRSWGPCELVLLRELSVLHRAVAHWSQEQRGHQQKCQRCQQLPGELSCSPAGTLKLLACLTWDAGVSACMCSAALTRIAAAPVVRATCRCRRAQLHLFSRVRSGWVRHAASICACSQLDGGAAASYEE